MNKTHIYSRKITDRVSLFFFALMSSCSYIYHVQLGEINNQKKFEKHYFEVKVSEIGINVDESAAIIKSISKSRNSDKIRDIIKLFQIGPRTGNPVYNEKYAENIITLIKEKCPHGNISSLSSIREMTKYPAISGEIIKITGYCLTKRNNS